MSVTADRIGFHYYPDEHHYTQKDLDVWLPVLESLHARWVTLRGSTARAVPETFVRGLVGADIAPIIVIPAAIAAVRIQDLQALLCAYARWGVRHVVVSDRPNMRASWPGAEWGRPGLVERYLDRLLPVLEAERAAGLRPMLPALEPGGDYWDTAFLSAELAGLVRRGQRGMLDEVVLAVYAWTFGHPLDWGKGGPSEWPLNRPYATPVDSQDQRGFRTYEWYEPLAEASTGKALPMLAIYCGPGPDPTSEDEAGVGQICVDATRLLLSPEVTKQLIGASFYTLTSQRDDPAFSRSWFATPDEPKPFVAEVKSLLTADAGPQRNVETSAKRSEKPIRHYLLLPQGSGGEAAVDWSSLGEYVNVFRPVVGFSAAEAKHAQQVTLIGDEGQITPAIELELRQADCSVQRVSPPDAAPSPKLPWSPTELATRLETYYAGVRHGE